VEDRRSIREAKATGLRNLPCRGFAENTAWLHTLLTATDLVCWAKLLGFIGTPALAHAEIAIFRNLVLHVAARITRGARQTRVRIDQAWPSGWRSPSARSGGTSRSCGTSATASSPIQGRGAATGSAVAPRCHR
jgi:hypothetical protein